MNELYPIVRRKRRPLLPENAEMLKAETLKGESTSAALVRDKSEIDLAGGMPVPPVRASDGEVSP